MVVLSFPSSLADYLGIWSKNFELIGSDLGSTPSLHVTKGSGIFDVVLFFIAGLLACLIAARVIKSYVSFSLTGCACGGGFQGHGDRM